MQNKISLKRIYVATVTGSIVMLVLVPLLAGAAPSATPTGGNVDASFNSVTSGYGLTAPAEAGRFMGTRYGVIGIGTEAAAYGIYGENTNTDGTAARFVNYNGSTDVSIGTRYAGIYSIFSGSFGAPFVAGGTNSLTGRRYESMIGSVSVDGVYAAGLYQASGGGGNAMQVRLGTDTDALDVRFGPASVRTYLYNNDGLNLPLTINDAEGVLFQDGLSNTVLKLTKVVVGPFTKWGLQNPVASDPVRIMDSDGLSIQADGPISDALFLTPNGTITHMPIDTGFPSPVVIHDSSGFKIQDQAATPVDVFSVDGDGIISNPGTKNSGHVYVGDAFEVSSPYNVTPPADWIAAGGSNPMVSRTSVLAKEGNLTLSRTNYQFSPTRKFYKDNITMDTNGSVWEFISSPTCNPGDGCGYASRSKIIHATSLTDNIKIGAHGGSSLGYLSDGVYDGYAFNEFVPVVDVNRGSIEINKISSYGGEIDNSIMRLGKPNTLWTVDTGNYNLVSIDNTSPSNCVHPITGVANVACPVIIGANNVATSMLTGTIFNTGQFMGAPTARTPGGLTVYTTNGGITVDSSGDGGMTINTSTGGLKIVASSTGGIKLNTASGSIVNEVGDVRIGDNLVVSGTLTANSQIRADYDSDTYGYMGTSTVGVHGQYDANTYGRLGYRFFNAFTGSYSYYGVRGAASETTSGIVYGGYFSATNDGTGSAYAVYSNGAAKRADGVTTWDSSSDERLKDIEGSYKKGLEQILQLNPIVYHYKKDNPLNLPSDKENVGLSAQAVQNVFPEAVSIGEEGYFDLNIHSINVAVINAIKELKAEKDADVAALKAETEALRAEVAELKAELAEIKSAFAN